VLFGDRDRVYLLRVSSGELVKVADNPGRSGGPALTGWSADARRTIHGRNGHAPRR